MSSTELFDRGLQPERTLLAWRRTCLALATADAIAVKLLALESAVATVAIGMVGLVVPAIAWVLATARYRAVHRRLTRTDGETALPPGGPVIGVATLGAVLFGVLALLVVIG